MMCATWRKKQMKYIKCKDCGKLFSVAEKDWRTGGPSEAEKNELCGVCANK